MENVGNESVEELKNILEVVKMQNAKIYEMQENQVNWNKQHALNLQEILNYLQRMYDTIKDLKSQRASQENQRINQSLSTVQIAKKRTLSEDIEKNESENKINTAITNNKENPNELKQIIMSIDNESVFDEINDNSMKIIIPCLVNIVIKNNYNKEEKWSSLRFIWEMARKRDCLFSNDTDGFVYATQLLHALQIFSKSEFINKVDCPLSKKEMQWLIVYFNKFCC